MNLRALEPLVSSPGAYVFAFIFGTLWGSFANVCIYRWPPTDEHPKGRSVVKPGSHCSACKTPIKWYDNVPLLSYLWLRGKCRACKAEFSPRYLLVEALTGALFAFAWWAAVDVRGPWEPLDDRMLRFAIYAVACFVMVVITFIDLDTMLILDKLVLPMIPVFYLGGLALHHVWYDGLIGAAIGFGVPWLIGEIFYRLRGREGLGMGDAKFLALVGALLGWRGVVVSLFGGSVLGSVITLSVLLVRKKPPPPADGEEPQSVRTLELPFGPYLAAAALFYLFAEPWVIIRFRLLGG